MKREGKKNSQGMAEKRQRRKEYGKNHLRRGKTKFEGPRAESPCDK